MAVKNELALVVERPVDAPGSAPTRTQRSAHVGLASGSAPVPSAAIPRPAGEESDTGVARATDRRRSPRAGVSFWLTVVAALGATLPFLPRLGPDTRQLTMFAILAAGAAIAQHLVVVTPGNRSYHPTGIFLLPAALLLPPELVALTAFAQYVPGLLRHRRPASVQALDVASSALAAMGAWAAASAILGSGGFDGRGAGAFLAGAAACAAYVGVHRALLAARLRSAGGPALRDSGLFTFDSVSTDLVLTALGVGFASLWRFDAWLIPFALAPLLLVHRSISVPALQAQARVDPKTGLFNARHFATMLQHELGRAERFRRPLSLIMTDLDLLREINNVHGHLAGDAVLAGIGKIYREQLRRYDVPARFGGEEFAILLPETSAQEALEIAERIRRAVADARFEVETSSDPIRATVSLGVAAYPRDGLDATGLIHQADLAVYRAKLQGRNCVLDASGVPLLA